MSHGEKVWSFETAQYAIECWFEPEDMDPADSFQFQEDIDSVRNGDVLWFCAAVKVIHKDTGRTIGADYLGGCAYRTVEDFIASHRDEDPENRNTLAMKARNTVMCHYFPDMVRQAIADARILAGKISALGDA